VRIHTELLQPTAALELSPAIKITNVSLDNANVHSLHCSGVHEQPIILPDESLSLQYPSINASSNTHSNTAASFGTPLCILHHIPSSNFSTTSLTTVGCSDCSATRSLQEHPSKHASSPTMPFLEPMNDQSCYIPSAWYCRSQREGVPAEGLHASCHGTDQQSTGDRLSCIKPCDLQGDDTAMFSNPCFQAVHKSPRNKLRSVVRNAPPGPGLSECCRL
jgi:hypothetical protein